MHWHCGERHCLSSNGMQYRSGSHWPALSMMLLAAAMEIGANNSISPHVWGCHLPSIFDDGIEMYLQSLTAVSCMRFRAQWVKSLHKICYNVNFNLKNIKNSWKNFYHWSEWFFGARTSFFVKKARTSLAGHQSCSSGTMLLDWSQLSNFLKAAFHWLTTKGSWHWWRRAPPSINQAEQIILWCLSALLLVGFFCCQQLAQGVW